MRRFSEVLISSALVVFLVAQSLGADGASHRAGGVYLSPIVGHWMEYQTPNLLDDGPLWGARLGLDLCPYLAIEGWTARGPSEISPSDNPGATAVKANYDAYAFGARLNLHKGRFVPFVFGGVGKATMKIDRPLTSINGSTVAVGRREKRDLVNLRAGFECFFSKRMAFRFDVGDHYVDVDFINDPRGNAKTHNWEIGAGFTFLIGRGGSLGKADSDWDGVPDDQDQCPDTPEGVKVYSNGCPIDSDQDGVPDYLDQCPGTPAGVAVDQKGCPLPVAEKKPEPARPVVADSDGDGVPDDRDACPGTPKGVRVDERGCPKDSDGDGVFDGLDQCPDTPKGLVVDQKGCIRLDPVQFDILMAPSGVPLTPTQKTSVEDKQVSSLILFDFDSFKIKPGFQATLDLLAELLKNTGARIYLVGSTDNRGLKEYNKILAGKRAGAVRDYLISKGVQSSSMSVDLEGENNPVFPNETLEERRLNRNVLIRFQK